MNRLLYGGFTLLTALLSAHCESEQSGANASNDGTDSVDTSDTASDGTEPADTADHPAGCGNGTLDDDEACDDGDMKGDDGCSANCLVVQEGWSCIPPGIACHQVAKCGNGEHETPELCDDDNADRGDGCSDLCQIEVGFKCDGEPSQCTRTVCGDGVREGAESCDDSNSLPFDGCSATCMKEPDCLVANESCTSECGDGLLLGVDEECDDGNNLDGDGCSAACAIEDGYRCVQEGCENEDTCVLRVAAVFRDFESVHSDFDIGCGGFEAIPGIVEDTLDASGKPVATALAVNNCIENFGDWYGDPVDKVGELLLYPDGAGNYVNRYGENGEKFVGLDGNEYDGTPLFFPVDDLDADITYEATVPEEYGCTGWPSEATVLGLADTDPRPLHNFYFTSQITWWFAFDEANPAVLNFSGDDDVWVFVNGRLAVDLGGAHTPVEGEVTINAADNFGMTDGGVYPIHIFHAERKATGSSFKLTLGGFNVTRSECRPECGDGVVGLGEECDDGVNAGGYGYCGPGCRLDGYCGDNIIQEEFENCDDGNFRNEDECPASCRAILID